MVCLENRNTQTWAFRLLETLDLETLLLWSVKNMEITNKNTTIDTAQTAIIHILEDLASLLDLCTGGMVAAALSTLFSLATSMDSNFPLFLFLDDSCASLSILLEEVLWMLSSRGQFRRLWCR